ncbi:putative lipid II flippase FtsW [Paenibacillus physcomitrellae]|uniref:Probable peptidoglycan glycosyltransferase FtsW n=1 Tax=Paenibacillus physcomitrellae TaxID=1619311 RepID=A0ABQ1FLQ7_9BACL|nr:putative lipid II flippase FtsW [Paenibacillus physcomitrellae]GGA21683.1 stage V sporulation protein E [Paenibacillus physcomitrellae]
MRRTNTNNDARRQPEQLNESKRGTPDFQLLVLTLLLVGFGLVMVFSSSSSIAVINSDFNNDSMYFVKRQLLFAIGGVIAMFITMNIPFQRYKKLFVPVFIVVIIILLLMPFIGSLRNGSRSWLILGPISIQPTEFAKITIILYLAALITKKGERFRDLRTGYIPVTLIVGFVAGLIMLQPDFGSCLILVATSGLIIFTGGANLKHIMASLLLLAIGAGIVLGAKALIDGLHSSGAADSITSGYKAGRFQAFIDPFKDPKGYGWNLLQSLTAIGHGGMTGTGFGQSIQKLHYLPNPYNDFIFSVIGEEFGFIGTLLFLIVYVYFIWRGLLVSLRCQDTFGTLVGVGIMGLIAIQAFVNIGGVTRTIPITGVTLPFISYGGSSLLVMMASMGIVLSISRSSVIIQKREVTKSVVIREDELNGRRQRYGRYETR